MNGHWWLLWVDSAQETQRGSLVSNRRCKEHRSGCAAQKDRAVNHDGHSTPSVDRYWLGHPGSGRLICCRHWLRAKGYGPRRGLSFSTTFQHPIWVSRWLRELGYEEGRGTFRHRVPLCEGDAQRFLASLLIGDFEPDVYWESPIRTYLH